MSFESEFDAEVDRVMAAIQETTKVASIEMINGAIIKSPVGNPELWLTKNSKGQYVDYIAYKGYPVGYVGGRFRSNWILSRGEPQDKTTKRISRESTIINGMVKRVIKTKSKQWNLTNSLPYAVPIDEGWSSQAPNGITDAVANQVESRIPAIWAAAKRRYGVSG